MIVTSQATQSVAFFAAEKMVGVVPCGTGNGIFSPTAAHRLDADQAGAGEIDGVAVFRAGDNVTIPTTAIDYLDRVFPYEVMDPDGIVAAAALDCVYAVSTIEGVVGFVLADDAEGVVAGAAVQGILALSAFDVIIAAVAPNGVVAAHAEKVIVKIISSIRNVRAFNLFALRASENNGLLWCVKIGIENGDLSRRIYKFDARCIDSVIYVFNYQI